MIKRQFIQTLSNRIKESDTLIQVLLGPRQVGKTTSIDQLKESLSEFHLHYFTTEDGISFGGAWIEDCWKRAKLSNAKNILVIDEIQKISKWSETIKKLWDAEVREITKQKRLKVILLGSSSLEILIGLNESLTGRFELIPVYHWDYLESKEAYGITFDEYLRFGGYPGSYPFIRDPQRWRRYLNDSIIETVIGKDLLSLRSVYNPALFRQAFELLCKYPAQEISYTKLLGQLQEKGNVELIKHYLSLFEGAFLFRALKKYSGSQIRSKSSSPKILPLCTALHGATLSASDLDDPEERGRLFEVAVGMLLHRLPGDLYYWRDGKFEVDYVWVNGKQVAAIEVKSGRKKSTYGLNEFSKRYKNAKTRIITPEDFQEFTRDPEKWLG